MRRFRHPRLPWSGQVTLRLAGLFAGSILIASSSGPAFAQAPESFQTSPDEPPMMEADAALDDAAADPTQEVASNVGQQPPTNVDWPYYGNDFTNQRYQDLDQINPSNVSQLQPLWIFHTGVLDPGASFAATPVVVDGTMYITTGNSDVFALDAATGQEKWAYHPAEDMTPFSEIPLKAGRINRGVAVGGGKVFIGRMDAILVALDATTGEVVWRTQVADPRNGYNISSAPLYFDGLVFIGPTGGEFRAHGYFDAYNAETGELVWRFFTYDKSTWAGESWLETGSTVWVPAALDPELGLLYLSTGNPGNDANGSKRAGMNLYANSVVALHARTGELAWYFQEIHHDIWDYDANTTPVLFDLVKDGVTTPAVGHCNKTGFYFILDRRTGQPLYDVVEQPVPTTPEWQNPWPTQPISAIEPLAPQTVSEQPMDAMTVTAPLFTPPSETPQIMVPGPHGGCNWPPHAYSPRTRFVYYTSQYAPHMFQAFPEMFGGLFAGIANPAIDGMDRYGIVGALDTTTGRVAWQRRIQTGVYSGLVVAGDLVFFGENTGKFQAVDPMTGDELWSFRSDNPRVGGANAGPIAYMVNGKEFIANAFGGSFVQAQVHLANIGDAVVAFGLPDPGFSGPRIERAR
jgi:quinohemoprotein ethanol dehydrogenase